MSSGASLSACRLAAVLAMLFCSACAAENRRPIMPRIDGDWWTVARNPDLGKLTGPPADRPDHPQQPVDFAVWQAADGTWQLWSCIRNTKCGGQSRLFHRWEGQKLTDPDWKPMGVAMQADLKYESRIGGLQAPHVVKIDNTFHMFYGDWDHMAIQRSRDGKTFDRWLYDDGRKPPISMFTEGKDVNTRDPMAILIGEVWHCYYTAYPNKTGAVYCRTSKDLRQWSESRVVSRGGMTGSDPYSGECPHVVRIGDDFYLFRTQRYNHPPTTSVYRSRDPMDFGVDNDDKFVCLLPVAAPELVLVGTQWYIVALLPDIQGIRIAKLAWE